MRIFSENKLLFILLIVLTLTYGSSLFVEHDIWWDSAVYLGMGKYIYSAGEVGLWESQRPIIWPLILGFFWKINLDPIFFGRLLMIFFSLGIVILTYLIASKLFNEKTALIAALFLSLSPLFFMFANILHTEMPSTFFFMLGLYFLLNKRFKYAGLFLGIAFMTRFFQIIIIIPICLYLFYLMTKKKYSTKEISILSIYFSIPVLIYLVINYFLYNNPFHPFLLQAYMTQNTGWIFSQPLQFYFINLLKENILILFAIPALVYIFQKRDYNRTLIAVIFLFGFIAYNLVGHKEMRLLLPLFPLLYILTSYGLVTSTNIFKNRKNVILALLLLIFFVLTFSKLNFDSYDPNFDIFYDYAKNNNNVWISNPAFIALSNTKAEELIYFPLYNSEKIEELNKNLENADNILLNTCDILPCPPQDSKCENKNKEFLNSINNNFNLHHFSKQGACEYYIFN